MFIAELLIYRSVSLLGSEKPANVEPKNVVKVDLNLQSDLFSFFSLSQKVESVGRWETKHFMRMA